MPKLRKEELDDAELIGWALPRIASGSYVFGQTEFGKQLRVNEYAPNAEDIEKELLGRHPNLKQAILKLRRECTIETSLDLLNRMFGNKLGQLLGDQLNEDNVSREAVLSLAYNRGNQLAKDIGRIMVKGKEKVSPTWMADLEAKAADGVESVNILNHYAQEVGSLFPKLVSRAADLPILGSTEKIPSTVQVYFEEASRCFLYGQFTACLILCRSANDFAIRDRFVYFGKKAELDRWNKNPGQDRRNKDTYKAVIDCAKNVFPKRLAKVLEKADKVKEKANSAVHKDFPSQEDCKRMFKETREILSKLYSVPKNVSIN